MKCFSFTFFWFFFFLFLLFSNLLLSIICLLFLHFSPSSFPFPLIRQMEASKKRVHSHAQCISFPSLLKQLSTNWWLKQQKCILSQFWEPEVQSPFYWIELKGCALSGGSRTKPILDPSKFWQLPASLNLWLHPFSPVSATKVTWPILCVSPSSASLF